MPDSGWCMVLRGGDPPNDYDNMTATCVNATGVFQYVEFDFRRPITEPFTGTCADAVNNFKAAKTNGNEGKGVNCWDITPSLFRVEISRHELHKERSALAHRRTELVKELASLDA
jgi:hypothetical protein